MHNYKLGELSLTIWIIRAEYESQHEIAAKRININVKSYASFKSSHASFESSLTPWVHEYLSEAFFAMT